MMKESASAKREENALKWLRCLFAQDLGCLVISKGVHVLCFYWPTSNRQPEKYCSVAWMRTLEVQIYTWPDATLRELTDLVKEVRPEARKAQVGNI